LPFCWRSVSSGAGTGFMNLPCDNCKAIRPFSREPGKCDVCGWECDTSSPSKTNGRALEPASLWAGEEKVGLGNLLRVGLWGVLVVGAVFLAVQYLAPSKHPDILTPGKYTLALKYGLTEDQVFMDAKPKGCDFTDAPLGDKHCHFEQSVNVVRECPAADCPVKRVYVSWHKVRD
jgi:hypothetical protein